MPFWNRNGNIAFPDLVELMEFHDYRLGYKKNQIFKFFMESQNMDPKLSKNDLGMVLRSLVRFLRKFEFTTETQKMAFLCYF